MKVFVVVDMQNDFISGSLGTPEAEAIVPKVAECIKQFANEDTIILFTADTHQSNYLATREGRNLPVTHCIEGTWGWHIHPDIGKVYLDCYSKYNKYEIQNPYCDDNIIRKPTFGSIELQNLLFEIDDVFGIDEITLVGLCTGICVLSNAVLAKATLPEVNVQVIADCCACVSPESHKIAIEAMRLCQIEIVEE